MRSEQSKVEIEKALATSQAQQHQLEAERARSAEQRADRRIKRSKIRLQDHLQPERAAEQEKERAVQQVRAQAEQEKERAVQQVRAQAEQEKERADAADCRADAADRRAELKSGPIWATLQQLDSKSESTVFEPGRLEEISQQVAASFFKSMVPPLTAEKRIRNARVTGESDSLPAGGGESLSGGGGAGGSGSDQPPRNQHRDYYHCDLWRNMPSSNTEVCHLIPNSGTCNSHWGPLLSFLLGSAPAASVALGTENMLEMVKAGYSMNGKNVCHTSLLDSAANHIMMRGQHLMDNQ